MSHSISSIIAQWASEWQMQKSEIIDCYKKLSILGDEQEDIEIQRSQLDSRLRTTEELVGLGLTHV